MNPASMIIEHDEELPSDVLPRTQLISVPVLTDEEKKRITGIVDTVEKIVQSLEETPQTHGLDDMRKKLSAVESAVKNSETSLNELRLMLATMQETAASRPTENTVHIESLDKVERVSEQLEHTSATMQNQQHVLNTLGERVQQIQFRLASLTDMISTHMQATTVKDEELHEKFTALDRQQKNLESVLREIYERLSAVSSLPVQIDAIAAQVRVLSHQDATAQLERMEATVETLSTQTTTLQNELQVTEERLSAGQKSLESLFLAQEPKLTLIEQSTAALQDGQQSLLDSLDVLDQKIIGQAEQTASLAESTHTLEESLDNLSVHISGTTQGLAELKEDVTLIRDSSDNLEQILTKQSETFLHNQDQVVLLEKQMHLLAATQEQVLKELALLRADFRTSREQLDMSRTQLEQKFKSNGTEMIEHMGMLSGKIESFGRLQHAFTEESADRSRALEKRLQQVEAAQQATAEQLNNTSISVRKTTEELKETVSTQLEAAQRTQSHAISSMQHLVHLVQEDAKQERTVATNAIEQHLLTQGTILEKYAEQFKEISAIMDGLTKSHWELSQHVKANQTKIEGIQELILQQETIVNYLKQLIILLEQTTHAKTMEHPVVVQRPVVRSVRKAKPVKKKARRKTKRKAARRTKRITKRRTARRVRRVIVYDVATETAADEAILNALSAGRLRTAELARNVNLDRRLLQRRLQALIATNKILVVRENRFVYYLLA